MVLLTAALATSGLACRGVDPGAAPAPPPDRVLLITVDTLRRDALGWIGGDADTPVIDRLARDGVAFPNTVAPAPLTLPSHASILTGLDPPRHGIRDNGQVLGAGIATLAEALRAAGFRTAAFVSGFPLQAGFGLDRGFDHYDDALPGAERGRLERPAPDTAAAARDWIAATPAPWFVWVHFYDPHAPYEPPREFWRPGPLGAYRGEVARVDHAIGTLLADIPAQAASRLLVVFAADHGEAFGEHGEQDHGLFVYDTTLLVPLVFHAPGRLEPTRVDRPVRLVDVMPTILELADLPRPVAIDGESLVPALTGHRTASPPAYIESRYPWTTYGWAPLHGLRTAEWKLIDAPRVELYDVRSDPAETRNLAAERPAVVAELGARLEGLARGDAVEAPRLLDEGALESLRALGYAGGSGATPEPGGDCPDPKDRTRERELLVAADARLAAGDLAGAVGGFDAVLALDPENRFALLRSAEALRRAGEGDRALGRLRRAVELDPSQPESHFALADLLTRAGRHDEAIPHWAETVRLQPRRTAAWSNLGSALGWTGRLEEAVAAFERALELAPDDPRLRANLVEAKRAADEKARPTG